MRWIQWNLPKRDTSPNRTHFSSVLVTYFNLWNKDTSLIRTLSSGPMVSKWERFHCTVISTPVSYYMYIQDKLGIRCHDVHMYLSLFVVHVHVCMLITCTRYLWSFEDKNELCDEYSCLRPASIGIDTLLHYIYIRSCTCYMTNKSKVRCVKSWLHTYKSLAKTNWRLRSCSSSRQSYSHTVPEFLNMLPLPQNDKYNVHVHVHVYYTILHIHVHVYVHVVFLTIVSIRLDE